MATEEEAREAADGKEVQVEAMDLEPFHMQTHMDNKLSSMEIKNMGEIIDSTEGTLKIPVDQVLVEAPSEIKLPQEQNLNSISSSLNGHMDGENKISNEQLHEDSKKDHEQVEAALDGESTDQNNKINKEANDCVSHGDTTTEEKPKGDDQQDQDPTPDTLKTDSDIDQSQLVIDQVDHNMDPAKATKDTQHASMANIANAEDVTEPLAGVQSPLDPNLYNSNAILGTVEGSTETDEAVREEGGIHLEHKEIFPGDTCTAKPTEEVVKAEDQQRKQADAMDADAVQEDIPKCEETGILEEMSKSEQADESTIDDQEVLRQQPSEDTNGPAYEKKEQTSQQSSMAASDDIASEHDSTTCEPSVDIQVQNKETLEEMKDFEAVDTGAAMQQSCVASEEAIETNNTEIAQTHNVKTVPSSEDKMESGVTARGPTSSSQEVDNVGSTEEIMDNIAENITEVTNVATVDEVEKENNMLRAEEIAEKNMVGIESEVTKSIEPVGTEEDSNQRHFSQLDDSAQEDNTPVSEKQQMGPALEINEMEATRTEAVPNASFSEEPSPEDHDVTESELTSEAKVNTTEYLEAIEGNKDTKTREIFDQNNMDSSGKSTQENNAPESEPTSDIQTEQEQESEEMKDTMSELHVMESEGRLSNIEATNVQVTPNQLNGDHPEQKATEETITSSEPQTLEPESVENMDDIEATKPQNISKQSIISPSEKSVPEEIAKDTVTIEPDDGHQQPQDPEFAELEEIETNKSQEIASSSIVSNYEEPTSKDNVTATKPIPETQAENLKSLEVMEDTENVKGDAALACETAKEENIETEAIVDVSPVQEPELGEAKKTEPVETEDYITPSDLPAEMMGKETMEIEAIPHESPVANIKDVTENDTLAAIAPHTDIQPVLKQESVEDKCTDTLEKLRETQQIIGSASDKLIPTEDNTAMAKPACEIPLQNVIAQGIKDSEDAQTDQFSNVDSFPTPGEAAQESKLPRMDQTSEVQEVQESGSTKEIRGNEAADTEDHQQHRVSTLEEPEVDNKTTVDDHQMHEEKPAELKDNEAMEAEQVLEQSNISTPDNAHEERSELGKNPDCGVQPAQQVESSRKSENGKLLNEEETSGQKIITLENTATEDITADEIDPAVGMEQEHEQKSVEEVKDTGANEAEEDFHTSQPDALDKLASESNIAETERTYDIQSLNDFETKEMKSTEEINDGDLDPFPTDNDIAPQEHPVESHEENLGNETENAILAHGMKDEIQTSAEQKDDAFDLGETIRTTEKSKDLADEDVIQSSGEDILKSSNSTDQIKEGQKAGIEHNSSEHHGENTTHAQDKDISRESLTEIVPAEASQTLIENDAQASQDVIEKDDSIKSGEQTNDHRQSGDADHRSQICESSVEDEAVQQVSLDERDKEDEEVESQNEQLQEDEQKPKDERDDVGNEPLVESGNTENAITNRTEETDTLEAGKTESVVTEILKTEQALHTSEDSTQSITDTTVQSITGTDKGAEEENRPNSSNTSAADAKMDSQEDQENTGKADIVPLDSTGEQDETTDEITNEELEPGFASSVQEKSHAAPSKDHILENDPTDVPYNAESGGHEDKECTNKVDDDLLAIQESEKERVAGMQENKEMQNEAKAVHDAESHTKAEEEMYELCSHEPYNVDTKIDDTAHNTTVQPRGIEETIGENKGLSSVYEPVVETSEQNNVEQDSSIHHKVEDEKMDSTEDSAVELEATQQEVDTSNVDTKNDGQLSISNSLTKHETESADDVPQLETEGNAFDKADEIVTFNKEICDEVSYEISEGSSSAFMNKKEDSNISVKGVDNIQTAVEIQADGSTMQINQDKQDAADNKTKMDSEKLEESNIQEQLGNSTEQKSPTECHEEDKQFLGKKETVIKEENAHKTVISHTETVKIKSNDKQELSDSKVQERDLNLFSPKEVPEPEENFVDVAKPEFSTDEKQSPTADELKISEQKTYERNTKDEEKIKNFTNEAMKTEAQVAEQKAARKKQNLLSGVGSKVKHQLAKVKKVITGKPGHTKPESLK